MVPPPPGRKSMSEYLDDLMEQAQRGETEAYVNLYEQFETLVRRSGGGALTAGGTVEVERRVCRGSSARLYPRSRSAAALARGYCDGTCGHLPSRATGDRAVIQRTVRFRGRRPVRRAGGRRGGTVCPARPRPRAAGHRPGRSRPPSRWPARTAGPAIASAPARRGPSR